jgi:hypothetical protein
MSLSSAEESHKGYWRLKKHNCKDEGSEPRAFRLEKERPKQIQFKRY